jgi:tRNA dimethylallyltransferase
MGINFIRLIVSVVKTESKYNYDLLVITGPTATGKTSLAVNVASRIDAGIISADSRQVYRGMNLGTGKDYNEYILNGREIPVYMIDIADAGTKYNLFEYQRDFVRVFDEMQNRNMFPVVCGGSGLYVDSIISGYRLFEVPPDEELRSRLEPKSMEELTEILKTYRPLHNTTDIDTRKRVIRAIEIEHFNSSRSGVQTTFPRLRSLVTAVDIDRDTRRSRITARLRQRLESGMVEEVGRLLESGVSEETLIYYGLEYKYITLYLSGKLNYEEMVSKLEIAIHQFAKRQMTWFRGMEKKGTVIHWIDGARPMEEKVQEIIRLLNK